MCSELSNFISAKSDFGLCRCSGACDGLLVIRDQRAGQPEIATFDACCYQGHGTKNIRNGPRSSCCGGLSLDSGNNC